MTTPPQAPDARIIRLRRLLGRFAEERNTRAGELPSGEADPFDYLPSPACYPGLRSFNPNEDGFFFGRQRTVSEIRRKLMAERMVVVQGGSGSGKSSTIRAGLFPRLRDSEAITGRFGTWYWAEFRPRTDPLGNLAEGLSRLVEREFHEQQADTSPAEGPSAQLAENEAAPKMRLLTRFQHAVSASCGAVKEEARTARAMALLAVLRDFAAEIDARDLLATDGLRAGPANLLLLVDQFEEVFRPEVEASGHYLLDLLIAAHAFLTQTAEGKASGLFIVVTMRSEELYRIGEHPALTLPSELALNSVRMLSLADVVNSSFYLIHLLDPEQDQADLRDGIIRPARRVLEEYDLFEAASADAPYAEGVVAWLLNGAKAWRDGEGLNRKADQLPLLQHALRAMWEVALARWAQQLAGGGLPALLVRREDLPGQAAADLTGPSADLAACLDHQADRACDAAVRGFTSGIGDDPDNADQAGMAALRAAIRALARRDDRGNWARRFASLTEIDAYGRVDPAMATLDPAKRQSGIASSMHNLIGEGYLSQGPTRQYDISHEALIRNWNTAQGWLRNPTDTAIAIERVLTDLDPRLLDTPVKTSRIEELIPPQLADRLAPIADDATSNASERLPPEWAQEQIRILMGSDSARQRWGSVEAALEAIQELRVQAIAERQRRSDERIREAAAAELRNRQIEMEKLRRRRLSLAAAGLFGIAIIASAFGMLAYFAERTVAGNYRVMRESADKLSSKLTTDLSHRVGITADTVDAAFRVADLLLTNIERAVAEPHGFIMRQLQTGFAVIDPSLLGEADALQLSRARMLYGFAQAYHNAANGLPQARRMVDQSVDIWESLNRHSSAGPETIGGLALARRELADLLRQDGKYEAAYDLLEKARPALAKLSSDFPNNLDWRLGYSGVLTRLGDLELRAGHLVQAERDYELARALILSRFREAPDDIDLAREVAWIFRKAGEIQSRRQDFRDAVQSFAADICIRRHLVALQSTNTLLQKDLGFSLMALGEARMRLSPPDLDDALNAYSEAFAWRSLLILSDASNRGYYLDVVTTLQALAVLYKTRQNAALGSAFESAARDVQQHTLEVFPSESPRPEDQAQSALMASRSHTLREGGIIAIIAPDRRGLIEQMGQEFENNRRSQLQTPVRGCWNDLLRSVGADEAVRGKP
jgi:tetratricopeptide (TPR) repeat protein